MAAPGEPALALVYLARGIDGGAVAADAFLDSYRRYPAGRDHALVVIAKGWDALTGLDALRRQIEPLRGKLIELPDDGFDWGAYFRIAPMLEQASLCFVNSHSRVLVDGWLDALASAAAVAGIGAVGATGSWGTFARRPDELAAELMRRAGDAASGGDAGARADRGTAARLVSAAQSVLLDPFAFPYFPNPHLRSNAFLTRRELFLQFARSSPPIRGKRDTHRLESGRRGFSRFLRARGLDIAVVGADRRAYGEREWLASRTFRMPDRGNLLVADRQSDAYDAAPPPVRRIAERIAWGRSLTP